MVKLKVGMNILDVLMENEKGRQNILKYAKKIQAQEGKKTDLKENKTKPKDNKTPQQIIDNFKSKKKSNH